MFRKTPYSLQGKLKLSLNMSMSRTIILFVTIGLILTSCENKSSYVPVSNESGALQKSITTERSSDNEKNPNIGSFTVPYKLLSNGIKTIHVKFNNSASFDAIFDTGCSGMLISLQEAMSLVKSGTLTQNDIIGTQQSSIASGEVMENQVFNIHEITLVDVNGRSHTLIDIPVTVVENPGAAVLLGDIVIDQLADNNSYTVDLKRRVIIFN